MFYVTSKDGVGMIRTLLFDKKWLSPDRIQFETYTKHLILRRVRGVSLMRSFHAEQFIIKVKDKFSNDVTSSS